MPAIYEHRTTVRADEIDVQDHANNVVYLRWMQDAAVAHSAAHGWPASRYAQAGAGWVVRSHPIEYLQPAFAGDRIVVRTWVATMRRVTSVRRYRILREDDHGETLLATAETLWAFVRYTTGEPTRIPAEIADSFPDRRTRPRVCPVGQDCRGGLLIGHDLQDLQDSGLNLVHTVNPVSSIYVSIAMKVLVVIGHQRQGSFCHAIAATAVEQLTEAWARRGLSRPLRRAVRSDPDAGRDRRQGARLCRGRADTAANCSPATASSSFIRTGGDSRRRSSRAGSTASSARERFTGSPRAGPSASWPGKTALVLTTSNTPATSSCPSSAIPLENLWKNCIFALCGISGDRFRRRNFESIIMSTPDQRQAWLDEVRGLVRTHLASR